MRSPWLNARCALYVFRDTEGTRQVGCGRFVDAAYGIDNIDASGHRASENTFATPPHHNNKGRAPGAQPLASPQRLPRLGGSAPPGRAVARGLRAAGLA